MRFPEVVVGVLEQADHPIGELEEIGASDTRRIVAITETVPA